MADPEGDGVSSYMLTRDLDLLAALNLNEWKKENEAFALQWDTAEKWNEIFKLEL